MPDFIIPDADADEDGGLPSSPALPLLLLAVAILKYTSLFLVALVFLLGVGAPTNLSPSSFGWQFRLAARLRTPILVFVVVPLSYLRWVYGECRGRLRDLARSRSRSRRSNDDEAEKEKEIREGHERRVRRVIEQIEEWNAGGRKSKLRTARPTWMGMSVHISGKEDSHRIDVGHLNHILSVNEGDGSEGGEGEGEVKGDDDKGTGAGQPSVTVEPGVTMGDLTRRLLPLGLMLDLHVEMESVTVGGAAMGFGIETNSHSSGFFQETVLEYELVDSRGNVRVARRGGEDDELFYALPWSHGSVGFLTRLKVRCARVKPYVNVRYIPTSSPEELTETLRRFTEGENCPRFVEATLFDRDRAVVQLGDYCDLDDDDARAKRSPVHKINHFWKPFYYRYVESLLDASPLPRDPEGACRSELIPLKHYAHRFTRSVFWELEDMIPFSNHPLYRALWGWLGAPEVGLLKLFQGPVIRRASVEAHVVQESIAPLRHLADCIRGFDGWFGVYPLLAFPVRVYDRGDASGFLRPRRADLLDGDKKYGMYVDLGAYGVPRPVKSGRPWSAKSNVRAMEEWTRERGGFQALYTDVFHTRREFREMFHHGLLDRVRRREGIDAVDAFAEVYDRVRSRYADLEEEERKEREEMEEEDDDDDDNRNRENSDADANRADNESGGLPSEDKDEAADQGEDAATTETDQSSKASTASSSTGGGGVREVPSSVGDVWQWIGRGGGGGGGGGSTKKAEEGEASGGGGRRVGGGCDQDEAVKEDEAILSSSAPASRSSSRPPSPVSESTNASVGSSR